MVRPRAVHTLCSTVSLSSVFETLASVLRLTWISSGCCRCDAHRELAVSKLTTVVRIDQSRSDCDGPALEGAPASDEPERCHWRPVTCRRRKRASSGELPSAKCEEDGRCELNGSRMNLSFSTVHGLGCREHSALRPRAAPQQRQATPSCGGRCVRACRP